MGKNKTAFFCQECGNHAPKWHGQCPACGAWNALIEEPVTETRNPTASLKRLLDVKGGESSLAPLPITELETFEGERVSCGILEFDRVLGNGCVPGSVVLLGGDPGIGKSTLLLQALDGFARHNLRTLYISGEESARQIRLRAERLKALSENLQVLTETALEPVLTHLQGAEKTAPYKIICLDSIQTLYLEQLESAAGSVGQIRAVAAALIQYAKKTHCIVFLIGHVTKEGALAGPRVLEHMVDTVLYFEGNDASQGQGVHPYRILRTTKNRYGSTNEIGVFEMSRTGLQEIRNPSEYFLSESIHEAPGSAITVTLEGTRPLLVEMQCLTLPSYGGPPRRTCIGIDSNRVSLLAAVAQRELGVILSDQDLYMNVAGGLRITEPAADLGVIAAMISSRRSQPIVAGTVFVGEVGLTGEVRAVHQPELRVQEAAKLGFQRCLLPKASLKYLEREKNLPKIGVAGITHIREILSSLGTTVIKTKPPKFIPAQA